MSAADPDAWTWALEVYRRPGVAEALLDLQDRVDQNVCLLLVAAWAAAHGRALDGEALEAAADAARAYETTMLTPLRTTRRGLKSPIPDVDDEARLELREHIKAVELAAERRLIAALEAIALEGATRPKPMAEALVSAARVWGRVIPRQELTALASRLSS